MLPKFGEDILYQKIPTFRAQVPNNISVAEFHKDKSYSHNPREVNVFLPITIAKDTSTIWVESQEDLGDYKPMNAEYGEYYIWNGSNFKHGNKINDTGMTRFSVEAVSPIDPIHGPTGEALIMHQGHFLLSG